MGPAQAALPTEARDSLRAAVTAHLAYLTKPELVGRATGAPGSDSAAEYLAARYRAMQIAPASPSRVCTTAGTCASSYFQSFGLPADVQLNFGFDANVRTRNVLAFIPGTDSSLAHEWLVIGAHYDHIGTMGLTSRDRDFPARPHLGADDNASGTAAVLALARRLADAPLRRPVMFVNFGAEEVGLVGSLLFVERSPMSTDSISAMFNFDMVGRLRSRPIELIGVATSADWHAIVTEASAVSRLRFKPAAIEGGDSDHTPFHVAGVPVLFFHTGTHADWHSRRDTMSKLDIDGIVRVIEFAEIVIRAVGDRDAPVTRTPSP